MTQEGEAVYSFPTEESVVVNTVQAVSEYKDVATTELTPIHGAIDTDALENILADPETPVHVTFRYEGLDVTVRTGNRISISESVTDV